MSSKKPARKEDETPQASQLEGNASLQVKQTSVYVGAIPSAEQMKIYQSIDPEIPTQIVEMAKTEGHHRRSIEKKIVNFSFANEVIGIASGLGAVMAICYLCYLFMMQGFAEPAAWIACTVIVSLAGIFVVRKIVLPRSKT